MKKCGDGKGKGDINFEAKKEKNEVFRQNF